VHLTFRIEYEARWRTSSRAPRTRHRSLPRARSPEKVRAVAFSLLRLMRRCCKNSRGFLHQRELAAEIFIAIEKGRKEQVERIPLRATPKQKASLPYMRENPGYLHCASSMPLPAPSWSAARLWQKKLLKHTPNAHHARSGKRGRS